MSNKVPLAHWVLANFEIRVSVSGLWAQLNVRWSLFMAFSNQKTSQDFGCEAFIPCLISFPFETTCESTFVLLSVAIACGRHDTGCKVDFPPLGCKMFAAQGHFAGVSKCHGDLDSALG